MKNVALILTVVFFLTLSFESFAGNGNGRGKTFKQSSGQASKKAKKHKKVRNYKPSRHDSFCGKGGCLSAQK